MVLEGKGHKDELVKFLEEGAAKKIPTFSFFCSQISTSTGEECVHVLGL